MGRDIFHVKKEENAEKKSFMGRNEKVKARNISKVGYVFKKHMKMLLTMVSHSMHLGQTCSMKAFSSSAQFPFISGIL